MMVRYPDWEICTGGTFSITGLPNNIHRAPEHHADILQKKAELRHLGGFSARTILFGNSLNKLTILEGNHRMGAYKLQGETAGFDFLPLPVIVGISAESHRLTSCQDYSPPYDQALYADIPSQRLDSSESVVL